MTLNSFHQELGVISPFLESRLVFDLLQPMDLEGVSEPRLPDALCPSALLLGSLISPREQAQANQLEDEKTSWNRAVFLAETILDQ